ncbi:electron transfer flavoprotein subunit beta/FixA family protein [Bacillus sp. B15-48]|uniref:electron transfer flavoprotein subunit beta/FixA family protein n=1 Tax=Bacillus sp. B15-48 TaxID=1548601 RepID=UPI00193EFDED|nr:electron transfer flavoprotein subunit beta/FixA family protein [Bacillus sp. B15-48]MBM4764683.1 electron transfer flavoprotein subunit beta/FixA family protein [Bacillus sp. B15-48]
MKALVSYKWIKDEADIVVDQATRTLNMDKAKYKVSEIDRNALELGVALSEQHDVEVVTLSVGHTVQGSTKDVLARGAQKAYYVEAPELDSFVSAKVIAEATKKIGDVDLVICGEGSGDQYSQQVGPRLAALLGYELVTYASNVEINGSEITVERKLDDGIEIVKVEAPAVITVLSEINQPRIPGMKQILSAKKKPAEEFTLAELQFTDELLEAPLTVTKVGPSIQERKQIQMNVNGVSIKEAVEQLVETLRETKNI